MDSIDEKLGPVMEVDEPVSVRDRTYHRLLFSPCLYVMASIDDLFAAKNMPDLGHEVADFQVYTWSLTNWRKLEKKITSPEFDCGGHKWYGFIDISLYIPV